MGLVRISVGVDQSLNLLAVANDFSAERGGYDIYVGQAAEFLLQHSIGAQLRVKFYQCDMRDDAGKVDRGLNARVPAANDRSAFSLIQRTIAMRTICDASVAIFFFARDAHLPPAGAGRQDQRPRLQRGAACQFDFVQTIGASGDEFSGRLQVHNVDVIFTDMLLQLGYELWTFCVLNRNEVFDTHRIKHLAAEAFGDNTRTNALARGVNRCRSASRSATDNQNLKRLLRRDLFGGTGNCAGIKLCHDLRQVHAALAKWFAV